MIRTIAPRLLLLLFIAPADAHAQAYVSEKGRLLIDGEYTMVDTSRFVAAKAAQAARSHDSTTAPVSIASPDLPKRCSFSDDVKCGLPIPATVYRAQ